MTTATTFDPRKTLVQIPTIEESVDDFLNVSPPKTESFGKQLVVNPDELIEKILDTTIPTRGLRVSRSINGRCLATLAVACGCLIRHQLTDIGCTSPWLVETRGKEIPAFGMKGTPSRIRSNAENQKAFT